MERIAFKRGFTESENKNMEDKLTEWEKEYIDEHLTERVKTDCYWDNPDLATEDVKWLLDVIKKLRE
jgi:hypothetical protein